MFAAMLGTQRAVPSVQPEFEVNPSLSDLERVRHFCESEMPLQRLVGTKQLTEVAQDVGMVETLRSVVPVLPSLCKDGEAVVRQAVAQQLGSLALMLAPEPEGHRCMIQTLVPLLGKLVVDSNNDVRKVAVDSLIDVASVMSEENVGSIVFTMALNIGHDAGDDMRRTTAVRLLERLSPLLPVKLCDNFLALELIAFADDPVFRVRKVSAQVFGSICQHVSQPVVQQKLLPCFEKLSKDSIWGVRKGCVESLVSVTELLDAESKRNVMVPMFQRFCADKSRWVRNGALECLGRFLFALGPENIDDALLDRYANIPLSTDGVADSDVVQACAFTFPAVAQTLGPSRFHRVQATFEALVRDTKFQVRRSLAFSLHEVAAVLGPELASRHVVFAFHLLVDDLEEVRVGVISTLAQFVAALPERDRGSYLAIVRTISQDKDNWRWRCMLAEQLAELLRVCVPGKGDALDQVVPVALELCEDAVYEVRAAAASQLGDLFVLTREAHPKAFEALLEKVLSFARGSIYQSRQLFVLACQAMVRAGHAALCEELFLKDVLALVGDRVTNVRITVARVLHCTFVPAASFSGAARRAIVEEGISVLEQDSSADVREQLTSIPDAAGEPAHRRGSWSSSGGGGGERRTSLSGAGTTEDELKELEALMAMDDTTFKSQLASDGTGAFSPPPASPPLLADDDDDVSDAAGRLVGAQPVLGTTNGPDDDRTMVLSPVPEVANAAPPQMEQDTGPEEEEEDGDENEQGSDDADMIVEDEEF